MKKINEIIKIVREWIAFPFLFVAMAFIAITELISGLPIDVTIEDR